MLTCIGLSKRTEKKPSKPAPSPRQPQAKEIHERPEEEGLLSPRVHSPHWSPTLCPHPWTPSFHTCQQPQTEPWVYDCDFTLPRTSEWDRFESLIAELDSKQADLSPPRVIRSITDLHISQTTVSYVALALILLLFCRCIIKLIEKLIAIAWYNCHKHETIVPVSCQWYCYN